MKRLALTLICLSLTAAPAFAHSDNPPDGTAGNPPEMNTCHSCHHSYPENTGGGGIGITGGLGTVYIPGHLYGINVLLGYDGGVRWGFELTVLDEDGQQAGWLLLADSLNTRLSEHPGNEPDYIKQTLAGTRLDSTFGLWRLLWISPPPGSGPVTLYLSGVAGNDDGRQLRDYVFSEIRTSTEGVGPSGAAALSLPDSLRFGNVVLGTERTLTVRVWSLGDTPLVLQSGGTNTPAFALETPLPMVLEPGEIGELSVSFTPELATQYQDVLQVLTNTGGFSTLFTYLRGSGTHPLPPEPFHLLAPPDGVLVVSAVTLLWSASAHPDSLGPVRYTVELDTQSDFPNPMRISTGTDTTLALAPSELPDGSPVFWRVHAEDSNTPGVFSEESWVFFTDFAAAAEAASPLPAAPRLAGLYPNPFNGAVKLEVELPAPDRLRVEVLDLLGRRVATLTNGRLPAGLAAFTWRPEGPSGLYFLRVRTASGWRTTHKLLYLK